MVYKVISLLCMIAFYGCYFLKMAQQKKHGIQTDQIGKGKTGFIKVIEISLKIATILVPLTELISIIMNTSLLPDWARIAGGCLCVTGTVIFITAVQTMRDSWRAGVPDTDKTELVTDGIFRYSRNPAFLGFDTVYLGVLLMFFNPLLLVVSCFAMLLFHLQIVNVEEDFLMVTFGDDYLAYRKHVNRYIGRRR